MKKPINLLIVLILLMASQVKAEETMQDSVQILTSLGDSCMRQYDTYEALRYYQHAYKTALGSESVRGKARELDRYAGETYFTLAQSVPCKLRMKLADCHYKRASYREATELLKNVPEDSLTHESFRQLAQGYQKQSDNDSYVYWASQLLKRYPMDGEMVAGLTKGYIKNEQPQNGIACAEKYAATDSMNILVNRALADAYFVDRQFLKAAHIYERLMQQGDSTFNTLYSAGMVYGRTDSLEQAYNCLIKAFLMSGLQHYGCAYRLGVVCIDTKRYEAGLGYLDLALQLTERDSTMMRALTLSQGEGLYAIKRYAEAVEAWKRHLDYNPESIATYYNIANTLGYLLKDDKQAETYYRLFLEHAKQEKNPSQILLDMIRHSESYLVRK